MMSIISAPKRRARKSPSEISSSVCGGSGPPRLGERAHLATEREERTLQKGNELGGDAEHQTGRHGMQRSAAHHVHAAVSGDGLHETPFQAELATKRERLRLGHHEGVAPGVDEKAVVSLGAKSPAEPSLGLQHGERPPRALGPRPAAEAREHRRGPRCPRPRRRHGRGSRWARSPRGAPTRERCLGVRGVHEVHEALHVVDRRLRAGCRGRG